MAGAVGGSTMLACAMLAVAQLPAHANPNWELFDVTNFDKVVYTDTVTASGTLQFFGLVNGSGFNITCNFPSGSFSHLFASPDPLSGLPNSTMSIDLIPDAVLSTSAPGGPTYGVCKDGGTVPVDVTTTGAAWTLTVNLPNTPALLSPSDHTTIWIGGTSYELFTGSVDGSLDIPDSAITFYDPWTGCSGTGPLVPPTPPSTAPPFTGTYDSSTGHVSADANQQFDLAGCFFEQTRLASGELDLDPVLSFVY